MDDPAAAVHQRGAETRAAQIHRQHIAHDGVLEWGVWLRAGGMARSGREVGR
jgi:hypothetical protein